ncbi:iron chelate uptake ABC transporter family permease subunit [Aliihoeflea aestuarii]|jgi:iron complex transport system permease protein|uniref:ABC transporter permease n=1 Tax=Aliihoeflea aestuarii TaxID=453840 RepID=UPI002091EE23|nr:ABC transporter permease [Aliihoeflea aestuarii]MCO6390131.1 iron chelate uptake ABC transporter family permease subunit [Aliihoeflea aestuarii]
MDVFRGSHANPLLFCAVLFLIVVLAALSLFIGISNVSPSTLFGSGAEDRAMRVLLISRIPRTAAILLAGSALAIAGLVMQIIVRNRFVEPSTAGTTESASLGFLAVTILAPAWPLMAKMGVSALFALAGTALFLRILRFVPLRDVMLVPLVGIMLGGVIGAITTFFAYRFDLLPSVLAWTMGDFSGVLRGRYELLWIGFAATIMAYIAADRFTVAGMGRDFTTNLGLNYKAVMTLGLVLVSIIASVTLVSVGSIPFLGLIVPNIVSLMVGDNMRITVPWVAALGALFVLICDIVGRLMRYPYEIPIGVVVGVVGSAMFLYLLLRKRGPGA